MQTRHEQEAHVINQRHKTAHELRWDELCGILETDPEQHWKIDSSYLEEHGLLFVSQDEGEERGSHPLLDMLRHLGEKS